jgi:hypothetical protein
MTSTCQARTRASGCGGGEHGAHVGQSEPGSQGVAVGRDDAAAVAGHPERLDGPDAGSPTRAGHENACGNERSEVGP